MAAFVIASPLFQRHESVGHAVASLVAGSIGAGVVFWLMPESWYGRWSLTGRRL